MISRSRSFLINDNRLERLGLHWVFNWYSSDPVLNPPRKKKLDGLVQENLFFSIFHILTKCYRNLAIQMTLQEKAQ